MICKFGTVKYINGNRYYYCSIRENGCPYVRWCFIEKIYKETVKTKNCVNYSKEDGNKTPSSREI